MKKFFSLLIILLFFIICVSSCNKDTVNKSPVYSDTAPDSAVSGVYKLTTLSLPGDYKLSTYTVYGINNVITYKDRIYAACAKNAEYTASSKDNKGNVNYNHAVNTVSIIYSVDLNGENEQTLTLDDINPISISSFDIDSGGNFYILDFSSVYKLNSDGLLISSVKINDLTDTGAFYYTIKLGADGNIYLAADTYITVLSPDLKFLYEIKLDNIRVNLQLTADNKMLAEYINTGYNGLPNHYYVDSGEKKLDSNVADIIKAPSNVTETLNSYSVKYGADYNIYYSNKFGVYGYNEGDDKAVMLCDWVNSSLYADYTKLISVVSSDKMVCVSQDMFAKTDLGMGTVYDIIIMTHIPDDEVEPKITITLAYADTVDSVLLAAINFNRLSEKYRVVFKDYSVYNTVTDFNAGANKFNMDMVAGNIPDIMLFTINMPYDDYIDKGMLVDLYDFFDNDKDITRDDIIHAVRTAYETNGKLYCLPPNYNIITMTGKASLVGDKESMTLEEFYKLYENAGEGVSVFNLINNKFFLKTLLKANLGDFVDYENLTCSFGSENFINYIKFIKNLPVKEYDDTTYLMGPISLLYSDLADIRDNKLYLDEFGITGVHSLLMLKYIYGDDNYVIKGYPTNDTNGTLIESMYRFGISSNSECKNGAFEFIKYFLTDKMQTSDEVLSSGLPVTVSALDIILNKAVNTYYYINDLYLPSLGDGYIIIDEEYKTPDIATQKYYEQNGSTLYRITEVEAQYLRDFLSSGNIKNKYEAKVNDIIWEELDLYYDGAMTAEQAADYIQSRVTVYINERY